jgi:hypothetical protein
MKKRFFKISVDLFLTQTINLFKFDKTDKKALHF